MLLCASPSYSSGRHHLSRPHPPTPPPRAGKRTLFTPEEEKIKGGAKLVAFRVYVGIGETAKATEYKPNMLQWQPGELEKIREADAGGKP